MKGHDDGSAALVPKFRVASSLPDLGEASLGERDDDLLPGDHGECGTHAGRSTVVMIGGSSVSGNSSPSK